MPYKCSDAVPGMIGSWWDDSIMMIISVRKSVEWDEKLNLVTFLRKYKDGRVMIDYITAPDQNVLFKDSQIIFVPNRQ